MPPTSALNATGQFFEHQFIHAWDLFESEDYERANNLCRELLLEPRLGMCFP